MYLHHVSCCCAVWKWCAVLQMHGEYTVIHRGISLPGIYLFWLASVSHTACSFCTLLLAMSCCGKQGGSSWARAARFQHIMYGVNSMEESASKILATIQDQPAEHAVVVMAHNGPSGLGSEQHDICGKDWSDNAGETSLHDNYQSLRAAN